MSRVSDIISRLRQSQLFSDSLWALLGSAIGKGLALLSGIVVARLLGSETYGEYGTIRNTLMMIAIFSTMGLGYSATKYIAESRAANNNGRIVATHRIATIITKIVSGFIAILLVIAAKDVAIWIDAPHLAGALRLSAIAIVFNAVNTTQTGELAGFGAYKALAKNSAIAGITTFFTSIILTYYQGFNGAIIALILSLFVNVVLNNRSIKRYIGESNQKGDIDRQYTKEIIKFSIPIALQESLYAITNWFGIFMLIKLSNYTELGLYSAAMQWMAVILFIPGALRNVALSHFSAANNDRQRTNAILRKILLVNFIATFVPFVVIFALSGWIETIYGGSFEGLQPILNICVFTAIVSSLSNVLTQEFISQGKNWFLFFSRLLRDVGTLITAYFVITKFSYGAISMTSTFLVFQILYLVILSVLYTHRK